MEEFPGQCAYICENAYIRVHGIEGLRVADASIMPTIVDCSTTAATVMIGEKAADFIRAHRARYTQ